MNTSSLEHRMICNRCNHIFDIKDAEVVYTSYGGAKCRNKVCPVCGGGFKAISLPRSLDKYLDINTDSRYYDYKGTRGN